MSLTIGGTPAHELVEWAIKNGKATRPLRVVTTAQAVLEHSRNLRTRECAHCSRRVQAGSEFWGKQCPFRPTGLTHEPKAVE
jgi:hypothetical protein